MWIGSAAALLIGGLLVVGGLQIETGSQEPISNAVAAAEPEPAQPQMADYESEIRPLLQRYCFDCHEGEYAEEGLDLASVKDVAAIRSDRQRWEKVFDRVRVGAMPPSDVDQPTEAEREQLTDWLDQALFFVDCDLAPDPGRVTIRRLNRVEYNNTIRDLVGVDFEPAADFPTDDVGYGFDNIGDVLSLPPPLMEKYLDAAEDIAERAIWTGHPNYKLQQLAAQEMRREGSGQPRGSAVAFASRGSVHQMVTIPADGKYLLKLRGYAQQAGDELARAKLTLGKSVDQMIEFKEHQQSETHELETPLSAGDQRLEVAFVNDYYNAEAKEDRNLYLEWVEIEGPVGLPDELPKSHQRLMVHEPGDGVSVAEAARRNLEPLLMRAFRRPLEDGEADPYVALVEMAVDRGETYPRSMQIGLQAVLVSPQFLFRVEHGVETKDGPRTLTDYELASRLSYFLWSSMPDDELFRLAEEGVLHEDAVLSQQVRRMMGDPRSYAFIENFGGQWLGLRRLGTNEVSPDMELFPDWSEELREAMWRETELFFASIVREDRPIGELLTADYSFLNERLANLYGLDGVTGDEFRRVRLPAGRRGLITQASVLTLTSYPTRTSPVKRGQWVLETILADAPPDPPPVVPGLEETQEANPELSLREQLEIHRADPTCASCHKLMDDIGFGLENFDAIGRWREQDGEFAIDSAGVLPSGEKFNGPNELIDILSNRDGALARCLAEKLLTYALGRGLEYYDKCTVDEIVKQAEQDDRFQSLLISVVRSAPFRMRRHDAAAE